MVSTLVCPGRSGPSGAATARCCHAPRLAGVRWPLLARPRAVRHAPSPPPAPMARAPRLGALRWRRTTPLPHSTPGHPAAGAGMRRVYSWGHPTARAPLLPNEALTHAPSPCAPTVFLLIPFSFLTRWRLYSDVPLSPSPLPFSLNVGPVPGCLLRRRGPPPRRRGRPGRDVSPPCVHMLGVGRPPVRMWPPLLRPHHQWHGWRGGGGRAAVAAAGQWWLGTGLIGGGRRDGGGSGRGGELGGVGLREEGGGRGEQGAKKGGFERAKVGRRGWRVTIGAKRVVLEPSVAIRILRFFEK